MSEHSTTPSYDEWFNGNPYEMIKAGTYKKFRDRLKGFTPEQMAEFDKLDRDVNGDSEVTVAEAKAEKRAKDKKAEKKAKNK